MNNHLVTAGKVNHIVKLHSPWWTSSFLSARPHLFITAVQKGPPDHEIDLCQGVVFREISGATSAQSLWSSCVTQRSRCSTLQWLCWLILFPRKIVFSANRNKSRAIPKRKTMFILDLHLEPCALLGVVKINTPITSSRRVILEKTLSHTHIKMCNYITTWCQKAIRGNNGQQANL